MNKKNLSIVLILGIVFTVGCLGSSGDEPDGNNIISAFTEHQISIRSYSGELLTEHSTLNNKLEYCRVFIQYPDKFKAEYISSYTKSNGTVSLLIGSQLIEYDPLGNRTLVFETNPEGNSLTALDYQGLLKEIIPMGNLSYLGIESIDDQPAYLIDIKSESPDEIFSEKYSGYQISKARVWVDPESWIVKKIELYEKDKLSPIVTVNYRSLTVNGEIPDDIFSSERYLQYEIITPPTHPPHIYETC